MHALEECLGIQQYWPASFQIVPRRPRGYGHNAAPSCRLVGHAHWRALVPRDLDDIGRRHQIVVFPGSSKDYPGRLFIGRAVYSERRLVPLDADEPAVIAVPPVYPGQSTRCRRRCGWHRRRCGPRRGRAPQIGISVGVCVGDGVAGGVAVIVGGRVGIVLGVAAATGA